MKARALWIVVTLALLPLATAAPAAADTTVHADLVEQNNSGVGGSVTLTATDSGDLTVRIRAEGLVPGPHAQHLHGALGAHHFQCASMRDDTDGDGWLTNEEASGEYGDVFLALTTRGAVTAQSGLDLERMPTADAEGRLQYQRTIPARAVPRGLLAELSSLHVVLHGVDANGNGEYDLDGLGESTFAAALGVDGVPEEATNPTACGAVTGAGPATMPRGGVETGGRAPEQDGYPALTTLGLLMVLLGGAVEVRRRRRAHPSG